MAFMKTLTLLALAICSIAYAASTPAQLFAYSGTSCSGNGVGAPLVTGSCTSLVVGGYGIFTYSASGTSTIQTFSDSNCIVTAAPYTTPKSLDNASCNVVTWNGMQLSLRVAGPSSSASSVYTSFGLIVAAGVALLAVF
eukprot:TRINITY_DN10368_c0_g1_i1.p1 TRINITY_DN10368_c0_g1~~TRINITY_DN10368_c0_g1_i1.p1  ORF type:complete len:139 (-),score=12.13 TRINITY_DN10368_c0_g1_i1:45-461(-)